MASLDYMIGSVSAREVVSDAGGDVQCCWCVSVSTASSHRFTVPDRWIRVGGDLANGAKHVCQGCAYCILSSALSLDFEGHLDRDWLCSIAKDLGLSAREFRIRCVRLVAQWIALRRDANADHVRTRLAALELELSELR